MAARWTPLLLLGLTSALAAPGAAQTTPRDPYTGFAPELMGQLG